MRRGILLTAFLVLLAVGCYGFWSRRLWTQEIWQPPGGTRFLIFLAVAGVWFAGWILARPAWLLPCTLGLCAIYTVHAVGIAPLLAVAFFVFSCFVLGRVILRHSGSGLVSDSVALLAGMGALTWLVAVLAHFPVNYPAVYLAILGGFLLVRPKTTWACLQRAGALFRPVHLENRLDCAMLAVALAPLMAHWLIVLKPEVGADALSMHLVVPASVAWHHQWGFDFRQLVWAVMPMGAVWCYTAAYLLGGEFAARLLNFAWLGILCVLVYGGARRWVSRPTAFLLAALFASTPAVQVVTGSLFVETFYAALIAGALAALWQYHETRQRPLLVIAAFLLASAMGVKLMALPFAVAVGAALAWQLVGLWRRGEKRWLPACAAVILALGPQPYLYSWWKTGNPAFPYLNSIFRSPYYAPVMSPDPRFLEPLTWRTPFDVTFETHRYWEGQDGSLGFQFLLLLPLVLVTVRRDWRFPEWSLVAAAAGGTLLGYVVRPNIRYLYPGIPLLTLAIALLFRDAAYRRLKWCAALACFALNLWFLPSASWYHKTFCLNPFERDAANHYLAHAAPVRLLVEQLNSRYPGESALFLETMDVAGLRGQAWSNGWHEYQFGKRLGALATPEDVVQMSRELGLHHWIFPNPAGGQPVREAQLQWATEFLETQADVGGFRLALLRPEVLLAAARQTPPAAPPGRYDDFDSRIRFLGNWSHDPQFASAANHSITYSDVPNARFRFRFRGSEIAWVYTRAANRGMAEALVDGQSRGAVDLYSPQAVWQARTVFGGLGGGEHLFEVRITGQKDPRSTGTYVDLDELVVK